MRATIGKLLHRMGVEAQGLPVGLHALCFDLIAAVWEQALCFCWQLWERQVCLQHNAAKAVNTRGMHIHVTHQQDNVSRQVMLSRLKVTKGLMRVSAPVAAGPPGRAGPRRHPTRAATGG